MAEIDLPETSLEENYKCSSRDVGDVNVYKEIGEHNCTPLSSRSVPECDEHSKKTRMKTARDVINRMMWDESVDAKNVTVGYTDRFTGIVEMEFSAFDWESDIASLGPEAMAIPEHRIQYFKYNNQIVWDKTRRYDAVFGSCGTSNTISDIIDNKQASREQAASNKQRTNPCKFEENDDVRNEEDSKGKHHTTADNPISRGKPNHFIGIRLTHPQIKSSVHAYQRRLLQLAKDENCSNNIQAYFTDLAKLHVTLCVCSLQSVQDIKKVEMCMQQISRKYKSTYVDVGEIGTFADAGVIHARANLKDLSSLRSELYQQLENEGIDLVGNYPIYNPHMSLVRARPQVFEQIMTLRELPDSWNFKGGMVHEILLCEMGSRMLPRDVFYTCLATARLMSGKHDVNHDRNFSKWTRSEKVPDRLVEAPRHTGGSMRSRRQQKENERRLQMEQRYGGHSAEASSHAATERRNRTRQDDDSDTRLSKALSSVLRHNKFGFSVDNEGYVTLEALLEHEHFKHVLHASRERIRHVVASNDKQRFRIDTRNGVEMIRANQGHSVEVERLDLREIADPKEFPQVIHGTNFTKWESISQQGLHRMQRTHIHMTTAKPDDVAAGECDVISGMRRSCNVFVYINIAAAMKDGLRFYLAANGVILSPGDGEGFIPSRYFSKVEHRRSGLAGGKSAIELLEVSRANKPGSNKQQN